MIPNIPTDSEIEAILTKEAAPIKEDPNNFLLGTKILPCTLQEFYDNFLSLNAPFNFVEYFKSKAGTKDIKVSDSLSAPPDTPLGSNHEVYSISLIMPLVGVPFCKQSRFIKDVRIDRSRK